MDPSRATKNPLVFVGLKKRPPKSSRRYKITNNQITIGGVLYGNSKNTHSTTVVAVSSKAEADVVDFYYRKRNSPRHCDIHTCRA